MKYDVVNCGPDISMESGSLADVYVEYKKLLGENTVINFFPEERSDNFGLCDVIRHIVRVTKCNAIFTKTNDIEEEFVRMASENEILPQDVKFVLI